MAELPFSTLTFMISHFCRCFSLMSGDKVLRLELESKKRCDDVKFMKRFVGNIVNDAKITESLEKISYSCCSSSCCNYNTTNTATTDAMDIKSTTKMSDNVKIMTKGSEATGNHYLSLSICCIQIIMFIEV